MRRVLLSNLAARALIAPLSAVCALVSAWLAVGYLGAVEYAAVLLITGLAQLLPFADFGVGAAVMNAISQRGMRPSVFGTLVSAQRTLAAGGIAFILAAAILAYTGIWPGLLGAGSKPLGEGVGFAVLAFFSVFATFVFFQLGYRVLTGAGKNHVGSLLAGAGSVLSLGLVAGGVFSGFSVVWFVIAPTLAAAAVALVACIMGMRRVGHTYASVLVALPRFEATPQVPLKGTALPMMVILVALPLLVFSHRLILSHVASADALIEYTLASQVYAPAWGAVTGTLMALWPAFASTRSENPARGGVVLKRVMILITAASVVAAVALALVMPSATAIIGHGQASASWILSAGFGLLILVQAAFYPLGMYLTRESELKFQAACIIGMLIIGLPLSILAASVWGAAGPVFVTAAGILFFQMIPALVYIRREGRHDNIG